MVGKVREGRKHKPVGFSLGKTAKIWRTRFRSPSSFRRNPPLFPPNNGVFYFLVLCPPLIKYLSHLPFFFLFYKTLFYLYSSISLNVIEIGNSIFFFF